MFSRCIVTDAVLLWHQSANDVFINQTHTHALERSTLNHNPLRHEKTQCNRITSL